MFRPANLDLVKREVMNRSIPLANAISETVRAEIVAVIHEGPHTGRIRRTRAGVRYQASAPGEPPASPTGVYPESWKVAPARIVEDFVKGGTYTTSSIAPDLEYGTVGPPPIEPRPHVRPAIRRAVPKVAKLIEEASQ